MAHKAGFVNIIGNPNVGKSTLMNAMVGEKLSIITPKAQTTRHRIMGILNEEDYQIVFSDTPGILETHYKLHESMMKFVESSFQDADIFLFVTSIDETFNNDIVLQRLQKAEIPVFLLLNKIDLSEQSIVENSINEWAKKLPNAEIIPVSALHKFNLDRILKSIIEKLPENPPYYSKDELTDKPQKFFVSEIIREKIFLYYSQEIPYCTEVEIESYKEEKAIVKIRSIIYVTRDSQKGILIGNRGEALKKIGTLARKDIEAFIGQKVFLEIFVKVNKDWRNNETQLKRFGYDLP
ncbi:MAG TPA: GTPase Era [Bacteroidales bacterium]|nr:GTPase Era [Bacteroidales bacterium]HQH19144.1 GTPase Era [Bacteroidales bacterium]HQI46163.1 GTPase Era [Bacteroidales bacterium]